jgi:hypothetical protein
MTGRKVTKVNLSERLKKVLVASMLMMPALVSLSACSSSEEFSEAAVHSACAVACVTDDVACEDESMRECVL